MITKSTDSRSSPIILRVAASLSGFTLGVLLGAVLLLAVVGCGASTKPVLRSVDEHVQLACEGLAQALAERAGADAQRIIGATCAVEAITRTMRERLLSEQLDAASRAGVAVPQVTSEALEPEPPAAAAE